MQTPLNGDNVKTDRRPAMTSRGFLRLPVQTRGGKASGKRRRTPAPELDLVESSRSAPAGGGGAGSADPSAGASAKNSLHFRQPSLSRSWSIRRHRLLRRTRADSRSPPLRTAATRLRRLQDLAHREPDLAQPSRQRVASAHPAQANSRAESTPPAIDTPWKGEPAARPDGRSAPPRGEPRDPISWCLLNFRIEPDRSGCPGWEKRSAERLQSKPKPRRPESGCQISAHRMVRRRGGWRKREIDAAAK